jgi:glycosyltransferase involved in cell wall biosynthesis
VTFDLIHAHFAWPSGFVGVQLKKKYQVPLVITCHGYDIYSLPFQNNFWKAQITNILNNSDHVITVSNSNYNCIKKLNINTPVTVIPNGFKDNLFYPMNKYTCKNRLGIPQNKKIILSVGALEPVKGHIYLIDTMYELIKKRKDILCIIIGDGALKTTLQKRIDDLRLTSYIILIGSKPHQEIPVWINSSDLFVLPSLSEGNPTVMFECLGCGKPFIGTNIGGIPEIINSKNYGFLVPTKNSQKLQEAILNCLNIKWDKKTILKYGKQFTWATISEQIKNIYKHL